MRKMMMDAAGELGASDYAYEEVFKTFDKDGDQTIDANELASYIAMIMQSS